MTHQRAELNVLRGQQASGGQTTAKMHLKRNTEREQTHAFKWWDKQVSRVPQQPFPVLRVTLPAQSGAV